ncbi:hypothetical protein HK101_011995, partial [Irineochytrium annulatum]
RAVHHANIDSFAALSYALAVNSSILIVAAAATARLPEGSTASIDNIQGAHDLFGSNLGAGAAAVFAVGLLFSGQCSTITGTVAGQVVMDGFLGDGTDGGAEVRSGGGWWGEKLSAFVRARPWLRRLATRLVAIAPALVVSFVEGGKGVDELLVMSQVALSALLPFAVWPLVLFTSWRGGMRCRFIGKAGSGGEVVQEEYVSGWVMTCLGVAIAIVLTALNAYMLSTVKQQFSTE